MTFVQKMHAFNFDEIDSWSIFVTWTYSFRKSNMTITISYIILSYIMQQWKLLPN